MRFYMNEIYNKFYREKINKSGEIENIEIDVKNDFNFAYDVLDVLAQKCTNKTALKYGLYQFPPMINFTSINPNLPISPQL